MVEPRVTKEQALKALVMGACNVPRVGLPVSELSQLDLIWAENRNIESDSGVPIWCLGKSGLGAGYGYGSGAGYGCDYGAGCGCDYGIGFGYGYGYGHGAHGSGYGDGHDDGHRYNSGKDDGYGYSHRGDGSGHGDGYDSSLSIGSGYGHSCGDGSGYGNSTLGLFCDRYSDLGAKILAINESKS